MCVYNSSKCQTDDVGYPTLRYTNIPPLQIIHNPVQPNCYLDECVACPGIMKFKKRLTDLVDDNCTDTNCQ